MRRCSLGFLVLVVVLLMTRTASAGVILSFTGGFQTYTVDTTGLYNIVAYGAQGGNNFSDPGGLGAQIGGDFLLTQGQILRIAVGGQGESDFIVAGGGGGTFVVGPGDVPLVIAGGGGSGRINGVGGGPGLTSTAGGAAVNAGALEAPPETAVQVAVSMAEVAAGASSRTAELATRTMLDWAVIRISTASRGELGYPSLETPSMADLAVEVAQVQMEAAAAAVIAAAVALEPLA